MAAREHSSTRRRVLGAAAALPFLALTGAHSPVIASREAARQSSAEQERWNRRFARYRRLHARWKAEAETGAFRRANDDYQRIRTALIARFGSWERARRSRNAKPLCAAAFARVSAAENTYYDCCTAPMLRALACLIRTPVPDLSALLVKLEIIREHEPEPLDDTPFHSFEVLREDVSRLLGQAPHKRGQSL